MRTPWGQSDGQRTYAPGIVFYETPSHGGFKLDEERNAKVPDKYRRKNGWYEEDWEYLKVVTTFPDLFEDRIVNLARKHFPLPETLFA